eukprot:GHVT01076080.1.p1 GENE.GHVT01076080.1~~GHVT01076080.1.p1  ORF type:complete len:122 (-),score=26.58 GHVT01076080.1:488-853(-)
MEWPFKPMLLLPVKKKCPRTARKSTIRYPPCLYCGRRKTALTKAAGPPSTYTRKPQRLIDTLSEEQVVAYITTSTTTTTTTTITTTTTTTTSTSTSTTNTTSTTTTTPTTTPTTLCTSTIF